MACGLAAKEAEDMRNGKSTVYYIWMDINQKGLIIADLTGTDPQVMYALGTAHTIGKETILICPQDSRYLTHIPRTYKINYENSDLGRAKIQEQLSEASQIPAGIRGSNLKNYVLMPHIALLDPSSIFAAYKLYTSCIYTKLRFRIRSTSVT